jgi:prevent-host-death family protein
MRTVTAREANQSFSKLLADVEAGETVVITKHGRRVAELKPVDMPDEDEASRRARLRAFVEQLRVGVEFEGEGPPYSRDEMHER